MISVFKIHELNRNHGRFVQIGLLKRHAWRFRRAFQRVETPGMAFQQAFQRSFPVK
jgi:hypothetical protein